jgi:50S ribosomal protein L20
MQRIPKAINKKRLVRYKEGAEMYSMGMNKFQTLAKDAGAILKIDRMVLVVDLDVFDQYLESFRVQ